MVSNSSLQARSIYVHLYLAGDSSHSQAALANLTAFCDRECRDRCEVVVIDVVKEPRRAMEDGIYLTPSLVRIRPEPRLILVGTLGNAAELRRVVGVPAREGAG